MPRRPLQPATTGPQRPHSFATPVAATAERLAPRQAYALDAASNEATHWRQRTELAVAGAGGPPERLVRAEAPDMSSEGPGTVGVSLSFDGTVFTSVPADVSYYAEPSLVSSPPASAAVSGGTPLLLKCKPGEAIPSTDAVAVFSSSSTGETLASVACTYVPELDALALLGMDVAPAGPLGSVPAGRTASDGVLARRAGSAASADSGESDRVPRSRSSKIRRKSRKN